MCVRQLLPVVLKRLQVVLIWLSAYLLFFLQRHEEQQQIQKASSEKGIKGGLRIKKNGSLQQKKKKKSKRGDEPMISELTKIQSAKRTRGVRGA